MRQKRNEWSVLLCGAAMAVLLGCGGGNGSSGSGGGGQTSPSIASLSVSGSVNQGETGSFTGTVSGSPTPSVSCSLSNNIGQCSATVSGTNLSVSYQAPIGSNVVQSTTLTVSASNGVGNPATTSINITIPVPQAIVSSPQNGAVASGNAFSISASSHGMTALGFTLKVDGTTVGNEVPATNNQAQILWNTTSASNGNHSISVVARSAAVGSVNSALVPVVVSNSSSAPALTGTNLPDFYTPNGPGIAGGITVSGAGFTSGTTLAINPSALLGGSNFVNQTTMNLGVQQCNPVCDPGLGALTATDSSGTSNILWMMFNSVGQTGDCSTQIQPTDPLECYVLDAAHDQILAYDQSSAAQVRTLALPSQVLMAAFDPVSKLIVYNFPGGVGLGDLKADGSSGGAANFTTATDAQVVAAAGGYAVFSRPPDSAIGFYPLTMGLQSSFTSVAISPSGSQPGPVTMTTIGSQVIAATYDLHNQQLVTLQIPQGTVLGQSTVSGISQPGVIPGEGGWYLTFVGSTLAFVSRPDNLIVFFDGQTAVESRRVTLPGRAISLSASNGVAEVALEDLTNGSTKLIQVDPATGNISTLNTTAPFGATMMKVNPAGNTVFLGNRQVFQKSGNI